jgi:predicted Na+-dependent transporter
MLSVVILRVVMLNVDMLSVVMLSVVAPFYLAQVENIRLGLMSIISKVTAWIPKLDCLSLASFSAKYDLSKSHRAYPSGARYSTSF